MDNFPVIFKRLQKYKFITILQLAIVLCFELLEFESMLRFYMLEFEVVSH